ncbi:transglutaminase domain-containing protein [Sphingoaurantiacus capsulatus]|uniref:Transglutaminase domain-containing protein n=1 Tax=Sphingoaurantiacus capsulatus TaxID=1771310 RepID=A0ABV7XF87_9SPHN
MRIHIDYRTTYRYEFVASGIVQALRLRPSDHDAQHVRHWRVDVDVDGVTRTSSDPFGNRLDMFYADAPTMALTIAVVGEADVSEVVGLVKGAPEPLPPAIFLRTTPLTRVDPALIDLAEGARRPEVLPTLHALMAAMHERISFDTAATDVATAATDALASGRGVCQDFAHIFSAGARHLGIPARYVSGHLARPERQEASHAWAEAYVPDLGWVAFDPANGICTTDSYLRVAVGLDYLDAAPVRGARRGGGAEALDVTVQAVDAMRQSQS